MDSKAMNRSQEVLYKICFDEEWVTAGRVGYRLHRTHNYISDVCRRERVDFVAIFNEILKEVERFIARDPDRAMVVTRPIFRLLLEGTRWVAQYVPAGEPGPVPYKRLCEHTGVLLKDLGGAIEAMAAVEADGVYNERDDVAINEFTVKAAVLCTRINAMVLEVNRRRQARAHV